MKVKSLKVYHINSAAHVTNGEGYDGDTKRLAYVAAFLRPGQLCSAIQWAQAHSWQDTITDKELRQPGSVKLATNTHVRVFEQVAFSCLEVDDGEVGGFSMEPILDHVQVLNGEHAGAQLWIDAGQVS